MSTEKKSSATRKAAILPPMPKIRVRQIVKFAPLKPAPPAPPQK